MEYYIYKGEDELFHYGTRGMKWGIRRYQNKDGSLTAAGRKRYTNADGTLNEKGKQYYAKERARLKAAQTTADNLKKTNAKFDRLDAMRNKVNGTDKKTVDDTPDASKRKPAAHELSDKELSAMVTRYENEKKYNASLKELGYDGPKTEIDYKIEELKKQKEYLQLQDDIRKLTPVKVSKGKQFLDTVLNKVIAPAATEAGKKMISNYLNEAGQQAVKKQFADKAKEMQKSAEKVAQKQANKEAKAEAKAAKKEAKTEAREAAREANREYTYEQSKKALDFVLSRNDKVSSSKGFDDDYESRVDKMLADMDNKGWELYEKEYRRDDD